MASKSINRFLGMINKKYLTAAYEKHGTNDISQLLDIYIMKIADKEASQMRLEEKIDFITNEAAKYGYNSAAELLLDYIIPDVRPANEVCMNCDRYDNQFCTYHLCRVNPFDKGCVGWKKILNKDKITHIGEGYIKYGK